jgi:hypothetical protein
MKKQLTKAVHTIALPIAAIFILNCISCTKEAVNSSNQAQLKSVTIQSNAASTFLSNDRVPIDLLVFIPCANGGAGEDVQLSGYLHAVISGTINGNNVRGKFQFQPQGIKGVGSVTGDKYQGTGVTQGELKGSLVKGQYQETSINNFRIIGQGNGNNFLVHAVAHITVNAKGVVTVQLGREKVECK